MTKRVGAPALVVLLMVALGRPSLLAACTYLDPELHRVGDHFQVSVEVAGKPFSGVEVVVEEYNPRTKSHEVVARSVADTLGVAGFEQLKKGHFYVGTHLPVGNSPALEILVTDDNSKPREDRLSLQWPSRRILETRSLQGSFWSFGDDDDPAVPLDGIRLTLLEGYSGREVARTVADAHGSYAFEGMQAGLYFLRLEETVPGRLRPWGERELEGDIPIGLNSEDPAVQDKIDLELSMFCGLMYTKR